MAGTRHNKKRASRRVTNSRWQLTPMGEATPPQAQTHEARPARNDTKPQPHERHHGDDLLCGATGIWEHIVTSDSIIDFL